MSRIYVVKQNGAAVRLVEADNKLQALNFVVRATMSVESATQAELVRLTRENVSVEFAKGAANV